MYSGFAEDETVATGGALATGATASAAALVDKGPTNPVLGTLCIRSNHDVSTMVPT